jgi:hypothetical protein
MADERMPMAVKWIARIKGSKAFINFYDLTKVFGPFKVYICRSSDPACPGHPGEPAEFIIQPDNIYQRYPQGGKYVEINFPIQLVSDLTEFAYSATTLGGLAEEHYVGSGTMPE